MKLPKKEKKKICLQNLSNISFFGILPTNFCTTIADSKPNVDMSFIVCFNSSVSSLFSLILTFWKSSGTFNRAHNAKKGNELLINANPLNYGRKISQIQKSGPISV